MALADIIVNHSVASDRIFSKSFLFHIKRTNFSIENNNRKISHVNFENCMNANIFDFLIE